jgi:SAM-dependent methyltransferase
MPHQDDHVRQTIATYDKIAAEYRVTSTPEVIEHENQSMKSFASFLPGPNVLVPGCGLGRDSRFLTSLGLAVTSFDLSKSMIDLAQKQDPTGRYVLEDLRQIEQFAGPWDGIWASGCLYHLSKSEFTECIGSCWNILRDTGVLYLNMKGGSGETFEEAPTDPRYPGGAEAQRLLRGKRFYAYYQRAELMSTFRKFELLRERTDAPWTTSGFEFWLRKDPDRQ